MIGSESVAVTFTLPVCGDLRCLPVRSGKPHRRLAGRSTRGAATRSLVRHHVRRRGLPGRRWQLAACGWRTRRLSSPDVRRKLSSPYNWNIDVRESPCSEDTPNTIQTGGRQESYRKGWASVIHSSIAQRNWGLSLRGFFLTHPYVQQPVAEIRTARSQSTVLRAPVLPGWRRRGSCRRARANRSG